MQQILPLALHGLMALGPRMAIMHVCKVYKHICSKVWNPTNILSLCLDVAISLSLLEMEFPPSFYNIMTHLVFHLVEELNLCGPMAKRWMYLIEQYMKTLKKYIRNLA
jgi:hypothetical protein